VFGGAVPSRATEGRPALSVDVERPVRITRHDWRRAVVDLPAYATSGLSTLTMGRTLTEDPLFFGAALAGGSALSELLAQPNGTEQPTARGGAGKSGARRSGEGASGAGQSGAGAAA
jgi:hypothetical protein